MTEHSFIVVADFGPLNRYDAFNLLHHIISSGKTNCDGSLLQRSFPEMTCFSIWFEPCIPEEITALTSEQLLIHNNPLVRLIASQAIKGKK